MAIIRKGGRNPYEGQVTTSLGMRASRPPLCLKCGERKEGQLYTTNVNGQTVCADCAGTAGEGVLRQRCDPETCACGKVNGPEPDPA